MNYQNKPINIKKFVNQLCELPYEIFEMIIKKTEVQCFVCWKVDYYHNIYKKMEFRRFNGKKSNIYFCSNECYLFT